MHMHICSFNICCFIACAAAFICYYWTSEALKLKCLCFYMLCMLRWCCSQCSVLVCMVCLYIAHCTMYDAHTSLFSHTSRVVVVFFPCVSSCVIHFLEITEKLIKFRSIYSCLTCHFNDCYWMQPITCTFWSGCCAVLCCDMTHSMDVGDCVSTDIFCI